MKAKVYINGIGLVSPNGSEWDDAASTKMTKVEFPQTVTPPTSFSVMSKIDDIQKTKYLSPKVCRTTNRSVVMAVNGAGDALIDSGLDQCSDRLEKMACIVGTCRSELVGFTKLLNTVYADPPKRINPFTFPLLSRSVACGHICIHFGIKGVTHTIGMGHISGAYAVLRGVQLIQNQRCKDALVGGFDTLSAYSLAHNDQFYHDYYQRIQSNQSKDKMVFSEGAAFCVLSRQPSDSKAAYIQDTFSGRIDSKKPQDSLIDLIEKWLQRSDMSFSDIDIICSSVSPANLFHENIEFDVLHKLCIKEDYFPVIVAPKYHFGESEACLSTLSYVVVSKWLRGDQVCGEISWGGYKGSATKRKVGLVCYIDHQLNVTLSVIRRD